MLDRPYCTLEALQRETGNNDPEQEAWFETCINGASRWIDEHCHRDFLLHDHTTDAYIARSDEVVADLICVSWPIITLTGITFGVFPVLTSNYYFDPGSRTIRTRDRSHWRSSSLDVANTQQWSGQWSTSVISPSDPIYINGTFGYVTPPTAVSMACSKIAAAWSHEKRRERVDLNGGRVSLLDERIPDDSMALLKRYTRLVH